MHIGKQPDITLTDAEGNRTFVDIKRSEEAVSELLVKFLAASTPTIGVDLWRLIRFDNKETQEKKVDLAKQQFALLRELTAAKIDPQLFDLFISNELDRNLKRKFAMLFFVATLAFTVLSYVVVVLNSIYKWGISEIAITALIIETPIQFIGLLYVIARNLFPQSVRQHKALFTTRHREHEPADLRQNLQQE